MPFVNDSNQNNNNPQFGWSQEATIASAPESSGVYGIFRGVWIYVGEAEDIRARLLEHLAGDNPCITSYRPNGFTFELVPSEGRVKRWEELFKELRPMCRGKEFSYRKSRSRTTREERHRVVGHFGTCSGFASDTAPCHLANFKRGLG